MVRYLIKSGRKIRLLPPAVPREEDTFCGNCGQNYDTGENRRACFDKCGHITCLVCIFEMTNGCVRCEEIQRRKTVIVTVEQEVITKSDNQTQKDVLVIDLCSDEEDCDVIDLSSDDDHDNEENICPAPSNRPAIEPEDNHINRATNQLPISIDDQAESSSVVETPPPSPEQQPWEGIIIPEEAIEEEERSPWSNYRLRKSPRIAPSTTQNENLDGAGRLFCMYCSRSDFPDKTALGRHFLQEHWNTPSHPCEVSDCPVYSEPNQNQSNQTDERRFKCSQCESCFYKESTLVKHMDIIHGEPLENDISKKSKKDLSSPPSRRNSERSVGSSYDPYEFRDNEDEQVSSPFSRDAFVDEYYTPILHYANPSTEDDMDDANFGNTAVTSKKVKKANKTPRKQRRCRK